MTALPGGRFDREAAGITSGAEVGAPRASMTTRSNPANPSAAIVAAHQKRLMKTFSAKPAEVKHEWFVLDATDKVLGCMYTAVIFIRSRFFEFMSKRLCFA